MATDALVTLREYGFDVAVRADKLTVAPSARLNDQWRDFVRNHKDELIAALMVDEFWQTLSARVGECDQLIGELCNLRGDTDQHRANLMAVRKRMAPVHIDRDLNQLRAEIELARLRRK